MLSLTTGSGRAGYSFQLSCPKESAHFFRELGNLSYAKIRF